MISRLHIITHDIPGFTHAEQTYKACKGGADWIQLRVKGKSYEEWIEIAKEVAEIARAHHAGIFINDSVQIAMEVDADGVHLGKDDMPVRSARMLLGKGKIIGGTANTLDDIHELTAAGADYIGLGPLRFTNTKENLSGIIGIQGYRDILMEMEKTGLKLPVIAIGGVKPKDVRPLLVAGVYGVAVASSIHLSPHPEQTVYEFRNAIKDSLHVITDHSR
jgi:thiamine-phosphate pyrophosphorylase